MDIDIYAYICVEGYSCYLPFQNLWPFRNGHGCFEMAMAVLIPLQGLQMAWPFRNGQLFLLAVLIPHQFDISGQVCSVAFKCNSCITIKTVYLLKLHLVYYETYI